ncbi:MAG: phosphatidylserine decarboxylase [Elusimicrobia bacterium]|nr:phosphatidylserine decarboxylase [Elusimicrobiota bacterium]
MRIARAGWAVIFRCIVGAAGGLLLCRWPELRPGGQVVAVVALVWAAFAAYFFRDPERPLPQDPRKIYSPGDGRVLSIDAEGEGNEVTIRIFLSIFNVHLQRAPCAGTVTEAEYVKGSFRVASAPEARGNERCVLRMTPDGHQGTLVVEQIAGLIARRIECWKGEGDHVAAGERYGMIHFGSQVAVTLPLRTQVLVAVGDLVTAGLTPIAEWTG